MEENIWLVCCRDMILIGKANKINLVFLPTDSSNSLFLGGIIYDVLIEKLVVVFHHN